MFLEDDSALLYYSFLLSVVANLATSSIAEPVGAEHIMIIESTSLPSRYNTTSLMAEVITTYQWATEIPRQTPNLVQVSVTSTVERIYGYVNMWVHILR